MTFKKRVHILTLSKTSHIGPGGRAHTRFSGAGLLGRSAGLSRPDAVGRQDSELVLHPGIQVDDGGRQLLPSEQLGN